MIRTRLNTLQRDSLVMLEAVWKGLSQTKMTKYSYKLENGLIIKLPNRRNCNNWRRTTLLSFPRKCFCSIVPERNRNAVDTRLGEEHVGFRPGRSCTYKIFIHRNIRQTPLMINFMDFQKAFDRDSIWDILRIYGMPSKIDNTSKSNLFMRMRNVQ